MYNILETYLFEFRVLGFRVYYSNYESKNFLLYLCTLVLHIDELHGLGFLWYL